MPRVEQRGFERARVWLPVRVRTALGEGLAVTYDVSEKGVLFLASSDLPVGERVTVVLEVPGETPRTVVAEGAVVHCSPNLADPEGIWRHRVGVALDGPVGELRAVVDQLSKTGRSGPPA